MKATSIQDIVKASLKLQNLYTELLRVNQNFELKNKQTPKKSLKKIKLDTIFQEFHQKLNMETQDI